MAAKIESERTNMQLAHEAALEKDKRELTRFKSDLEDEKLAAVEKEVRRMKEILTQEYEFKSKHLVDVHYKKINSLIQEQS